MLYIRPSIPLPSQLAHQTTTGSNPLTLSLYRLPMSNHFPIFIMSLPKMTKGWAIEGQDNFDNLKFDTQQPLPELSDNEVLVRFHSASLNFRDIMIAQVNKHSLNPPIWLT